MREEARQLREPAAWLLAAAVVSRGAGLGAGVLMARILGPEQFGTFVLVQSAAAFFAGLGGLGLGLALTRQLAAIGADVAAGARYLSTAIGATLAGAALVTAIFVAGSDRLASDLLHLPGSELLLAAAGGIFFAALAGTFQGGLLGFEAFPQMAGSQILQGLALAGGGVVGALAGGAGWALAGTSLAYAASAVGSLALLGRVAARRAIVLRARPDGPTWQRLWPLAAPALSASVVLFAALLVCQVVLSRQSGGEAEVASFNLAYRWHMAILFVPSALAPLLLPVMTRFLAGRAQSNARRVFMFQLILNIAITTGPALVLVLLAETVLGLSGDYYRDSSEALQILAIASVPSAVNNVLSSAALSLGAVRLWLVSDVVLAVALIGGTLLLVPGLGAAGLAWSFLIAYVATDLVLLVGLRTRISA